MMCVMIQASHDHALKVAFIVVLEMLELEIGWSSRYWFIALTAFGCNLLPKRAGWQ